MNGGDQLAIPRLLRPAEVARLLTTSRTTVYRLIGSGELPCVRFAGATVRVKESDLAAFIEEHSGNGREHA